MRRKRCPKCGELGEERKYTDGARAFFHKRDPKAPNVILKHCMIGRIEWENNKRIAKLAAKGLEQLREVDDLISRAAPQSEG